MLIKNSVSIDKVQAMGNYDWVVNHQDESYFYTGQMKDGYKGIKYEKVIPFLIDSIQQLTRRVEELEDK